MRIEACTLFAVALCTAFGASSLSELSYPNLTVNDLCGRVDRQIAALGDIVMHEEISRYTSVRGKSLKVDEFDASVEIADGVDSFASLRRNSRPYSTAAQIPGAWSVGEFSTMLRISREVLSSGSVRLVPAFGSEPASLVAEFRYPASSARWFVAVGKLRYWLDFQGEIRMSAETGDVLRVSWTSAPLAREAGIERIERTVRFAPAEVGGEIRVLPESAEYRVVHSGDRQEWNTARFTAPARYGSVVSLTYQK
jgi:hypothetical protein